MGIPQAQFVPWTRKHDKPGTPLIPQAPKILYPQSLEDLIQICSTRPAGQRLHAAGSHWALSQAAISDHAFIETHDWNNLIPAMGRTLYEVVPGCMSTEFLNEFQAAASTPLAASVPVYYVHFEAGKRIYQLYAELDVGDGANNDSLCALMKSRFNNSSFEGSWAFHTLGGAGGQTVVGALSTGTHGGDFDRPPIADAVVALHVVADGGKHYWIERGHPIERGRHAQTPFTDETKLRALYGAATYGGPKNFDVIYDDDVLRAAMVQVGRFGTVYSAVIQVTRQYGLREELLLDTWETVQNKIADPNSDLFVKPFASADGVSIPQRFLQIVINPIPSTNGTAHICGITRRWTRPLSALPTSPMAAVTWSPGVNPAGRPELVGNIVRASDPLLNAPLFSAAGQTVGYSPNDDGITSFSLYDSACADANFMDGIVNGIYTEIENFLGNHAVAIGGGLAGALAAGLGPGLLALAPALLAILAILALFLNALRSGGSTVGQALNNLRGALLGSSDPTQRAAGIVVWRAIAAEAFKSQQSPQTYSAISYAIMDTHDYTDISCDVNVRSMEVFFDAADPNLLAFVNRLLQFEIDQEFESGYSVAGYVSLRFCGQSSATIAQEAFQRTCAIECSGLADELGSGQFVDYATKLALDPNIKGILHWGQQNTSTQADIEFRFGDTPADPTGPLQLWRSVLARLTDNGRLDGYSSEFTRQTGLEIVQPVVSTFAVSSPPSSSTHSCAVAWNCTSNPPETMISLEIKPPSGSVTAVSGLPLGGSHNITATLTGAYTITLIAGLDRNGVTRKATQVLTVTFA
jgi:hypothetical protein